MQKVSFFLILICCFSSLLSLSQISTNEYPPSFYSSSEKSTNSNVIYQVETPNIKALEKQDKIEDQDKSIPWRFGALIKSDIRLQNSDFWTSDNLGNSKWVLNITAKGALSINLNMIQFHLSKNAKLFFYNSDYSDVLGAITSKNNKVDSIFSIRPIKGEQVYIELQVPTSEIEDCSFIINRIIYGYRSMHEKSMKAFNNSGSCNLNVNCPEGNNWQDAKRAVAIITTASNTRACTGTLLNNVRQDTTPYFLTAAHCGTGTNSIFIFNYESPNCTPTTDGILSNSISGAFQRALANAAQPDFHLFELSNKPPSSYNVYYAGWSAVDTAAPKSVAIHHPTGDVKKISINTDSIKSTVYEASPPNYYWANNWEIGTTEGGSSGSPLFDQNQRVIGQLHGGDAACGNHFQDFYGKFAISWNSLPAKGRQLKAWLDPDSTNVLVLDGLDPNPAYFNNDLQLIGIEGIPYYHCDFKINPILSVRNKGNLAVDSFKVIYQLDNGSTQKIDIYRRIIRNQVIKVSLPQLILGSGTHKFTTSIGFSSNNKTDQDYSNNIANINFQSNDSPIEAIFTLKTDDYGDETSWDIKSSTGKVLYIGGPFESISGGSIYTKSLCLYDNCFDLTLFDSFEDGFNGMFGSGYALITSSKGDTLLYENSFTTSTKTINFCVPPITSLEENNLNVSQIRVFPNPVKQAGILTIIEEPKQNNNYQLIDLTGRTSLSFTSKQFQLPQTTSVGVYFLLVKSKLTNEVISYQKIIVK